MISLVTVVAEPSCELVGLLLICGTLDQVYHTLTRMDYSDNWINTRW